ncbi:radical SAM protein [Carboxylicivirga sp. N1Y90]|uniref:radical SAM protein n=1 Tax=Carboxylicivirga fragile TaxID=3417571 RepID=UPI003D3256B5|nr:radical SAM protein [Marinilabiliaceae bacterium N1Y90]
MLYEQPIFRPPAEANSLIIQLTIGCDWNKCRFCEMYTSKMFRVKPISQIESDINYLSQTNPAIRRIFIGDADIFAADFDSIIATLNLIKIHFPKAKRISAYASARGIKKFSTDQLSAIRLKGLILLYGGIESGDNNVLELINKGSDAKKQTEAFLTVKNAGFKLSLMVLNGLGGKELSKQHALNTAKLLNKVQPELLSSLVVSYPFEFEHFKKRLKKEFTPLSAIELCQELHLLISHLKLESTVFRSDHVSNYLILKGALNKDKEKFLAQLEQALSILPNTDEAFLNENTVL